MSEAATEGTIDPATGEQVVELPPQGDAAFGALMDALAPEAAGEAAGQGDQGTDAAAGAGDGAGKDAGAGAEAPAPDTGAGDGTGTGAKPADADAGKTGTATGTTPGVGDGGGSGTDAGPGAGDRPADWTASSADLIPKFGLLSNALEERTAQAYQTAALEAVKTEHAPYFEALQKHPRMLAGTRVPRLTGEGEETLRDAADAKEWQEALKSILVDEVKARASKQMDENSDFLTTIHSSIELFQNNTDLIPGTKDFDVELANRFTTMAEPYELRVEGKLQGYSIPVQPIIAQLRSQIAAQRATKADTAGTASGTAQTAAAGAGASTPPTPAAAPVDQPQAGVPSKAGSGTDAEDFSTLFGTIGLPNLQI